MQSVRTAISPYALSKKEMEGKRLVCYIHSLYIGSSSLKVSVFSLDPKAAAHVNVAAMIILL